MMIRIAAALAALLSTPAAQAQATDALFDLLCGRSTHFYDEGGNQIEYTAGDGTAYLWHHTDTEVIVGTWAVSTTEEGAAQVCYQYPRGAFGVELVLPTYCFSESDLFDTVVQGGVFDGDRYGLRDGQPPYPLPEHPFVPLESFDADFPRLPPEPTCGLPLS